MSFVHRNASRASGPSVAFALPAGLTNGGVTTWALALSKRLNQKKYLSKLICHSAWPDHATFDVNDRTDIVHCDGLAWTAGVDEIRGFLPTYSAVKAKIFVPNWSWATYGTVSLMSLNRACDARVIAFAHSDQDHYYDLLCYYAPIVSKFIGVSETICRQLHYLLPSRSDDICKLLSPVAVRDEPRRQESLVTLMSDGGILAWYRRTFHARQRHQAQTSPHKARRNDVKVFATPRRCH